MTTAKEGIAMRTEPLLMSVDSAAAACGVGRSIFYQRVLRGEVRSVLIGRRRLISLQALKDYILWLEEEQGRGNEDDA